MTGSSGIPQRILLKRQIVGRGFGYDVFTALGVLRVANGAFPRRISLKGPSHEKIAPHAVRIRNLHPISSIYDIYT